MRNEPRRDIKGQGRQRGMNSRNVLERDRSLALRAKAWQLHLEGWSVRRIGKTLNRSRTVVSRWICEWREQLRPELALTRAQMLVDARGVLLQAMAHLQIRMVAGNTRTALQAGRAMLKMAERLTLLAGIRTAFDVKWVQARGTSELADIRARLAAESVDQAT
jgi:hypothetical protein